MSALRGRNTVEEPRGVAIPERRAAKLDDCLALRIALTGGGEGVNTLPLLPLAELLDVAFLPVPMPVFRLGCS